MPKKPNKGGGQTEEEKLVYLQRRAEAEEELAKKKQELLTLFLKDKLQKEQRSSAWNLRKLDDTWRTVLRQTRCAELRKELCVLSRTWEKRLDGLDGVVKSVTHDLQEAERHSAQVNRAHLQNLERLCAQLDLWRGVQQQRWEESLQHLNSRVHSERERMGARCEELRAHLDDAALGMEQQHKDAMSDIGRRYNPNITEYQNSPDATKFNLLAADKQTLMDLAQQNQKDRNILEQNTRDLTDRVITDKVHAKKRAAVEKDIKDSKVSITQMKMSLKSSKTEQDRMERHLTGAGKQLNAKTAALRDRRSRCRTAARRQMTDLSVQGGGANRKLQEAIKKGERVLRVAEMCRKLETEQEDTFTSVSAADDQRQAERDPAERDPAERDPAAKRAEFPELQQVLQHINATLLRREVLKKQRADLSRENQQLKILLRQHLDAMTVSSSTIDGPHALLTVYQAPTTTAPAEPTRRHTVIEAAHAAKH